MAECGDPVAEALVDAVRELKEAPELHARLAENAYQHARTHYDRTTLARRYAGVLAEVAGAEETVLAPA